MKKYLFLLDQNLRWLFILIYRYSPSYESLLKKTNFTPPILDEALKKLVKNGIIFEANLTYHIHPKFQKSLTKLLLGTLTKIILLALGLILNKQSNQKSRLHLEELEKLKTQQKKSR